MWPCSFSKVLDTLLTHIAKLAAKAAAAPPTNPYAVMFGMEDAESLPNQIRGLIQDIRSTEPALADRIMRAVCGGDAVTWTSPAGAYTTAAGNVYLKSIAAKIAGGTIVLSSDGTAESVDGVKAESLPELFDAVESFPSLKHTLAGKIAKAEFSNADHLAHADADADEGDAVPVLLKGTVDSVMGVECEFQPSEAASPNACWHRELGAPAMKTVTLTVGCTLAVAAGTATCVGEITLTAPEPGWSPGHLAEGYLNEGEFYNERDDIRPSLYFQATVNDGGGCVERG